jgi:hypothetical protein
MGRKRDIKKGKKDEFDDNTMEMIVSLFYFKTKIKGNQEISVGRLPDLNSST